MFKNILLVAILLITPSFAKEKFFVVERESSSLATIYDGLQRSHIVNMGNMNHGVLKFDGKDAYIISRDGYVTKFNPLSEKIEAKYKTSKSAIGFVIGKHFLAVANYDDKSVDILDRDLKPIKKIKTNSKNVGIKIYKDYLIFSQMDNDKITVLKDMNHGKGNPDFKIYKEFSDVGSLPFDAMIKDGKYISGFFVSKHFGVLDLDKMTYKKVQIFLDKNRQMILKVPHFGFWSIKGDKIFVPAVGDNKVLVYDNDFNFIKNIETKGLPVFTSLSPDNKYLAVTYSGKDFPTIQIIDTNTLKVIHTFSFNGKVLHLRWSKEHNDLYVSVNDANTVAVINTKDWYLQREIFNVQKPSGIFLYEYGE